MASLYLWGQQILIWKWKAKRFFELRDHATARMLGAEKDLKESDEEKKYRELFQYMIEQSSQAK